MILTDPNGVVTFEVYFSSWERPEDDSRGVGIVTSIDHKRRTVTMSTDGARRLLTDKHGEPAALTRYGILSSLLY